MNNVDIGVVKCISQSLKTNTTLTILNIGGRRYIFSFLNLNITANHIGDEGSKYISQSLKTNTTLTLLNIVGKRYFIFLKSLYSELKDQNIFHNH